MVWSQTQLVWTKLFPHHQYHIIIIIIIIIITITIIILTIIFRPGLPSSATRPELESLATRVHPFISASQGQPSTLSSQSPLVQNRQIPFSSLPTTQTQNPKSRLSREPHTTRHGAFLSTSLHPPKIKNQHHQLALLSHIPPSTDLIFPSSRPIASAQSRLRLSALPFFLLVIISLREAGLGLGKLSVPQPNSQFRANHHPRRPFSNLDRCMPQQMQERPKESFDTA